MLVLINLCMHEHIYNIYIYIYSYTVTLHLEICRSDISVYSFHSESIRSVKSMKKYNMHGWCIAINCSGYITLPRSYLFLHAIIIMQMNSLQNYY